MIIHSLEVKNFKILKNFKYNLSDNVNLLFGANGSGKTTVTEILNFFMQLNKRKMVSYRMSLEDRDSDIAQTFKNVALDYYNNYSTCCDDKSNIYLKMKFEVDKIPCEYTVELDNTNVIVEEILKMKLNQRLSTVYNRSTKQFTSELENIIKPYYYFFENESRTTFLSIFDYLLEVELDDEVKKSSKVLNNIRKTIDSIICNTDLHNRGFDIKHANQLSEMNSIAIDEHFETNFKDFSRYVENFSDFVTEIDDTIIECKSVLLDENERMRIYSIVAVKEFYGDEIEVPFTLESTGTKKYLDYFDWISKMIGGIDSVYVCDEFGLHLHSNLQYRILEYLTRIAKEKGIQMILSTHNSSLLNCEWLNKDEKQVINVNPITGERRIMNLVGKDSKENFNTKYLGGFYGGAPKRSKLNLNFDG